MEGKQLLMNGEMMMEDAQQQDNVGPMSQDVDV
jgi:hypothetical protein